MEETWNSLSAQYIEVKRRNQEPNGVKLARSVCQESLQSKKVYQHMLKRTQREQAILKQKLFQMEDLGAERSGV